MRKLPEEPRANIDMALSRLVRRGAVRRLRPGLYDVPQMHPTLGKLPADPIDVAEALARADGARLVPSGALALNQLGLSTQVPAKLLFRTTGPSRVVRVGNVTIELRHSSPGRLRVKDHNAALVIEALRAIGASQVTPQIIQRLRESLPQDVRESIVALVSEAPAWMREHLMGLTDP